MKYVAFLRGVNVGGKNKLPMEALARLFADAKCSNVRTYIQSGNVIFDAEAQVCRGLDEIISGGIQKEFGVRVPMVLRSMGQLSAVVSNNPFRETGAPEESLHVMFLADVPAAKSVGALDPDRSPPDAFVVRGREIYLNLPNGMGRTKLTNAYFDSRLQTISTARNWRTVTKLLELMHA